MIDESSINSFVTVEEIVNENREELSLTILSGKNGLGNHIKNKEVIKCGLAFVGYTDHLLKNSVLIADDHELKFLSGLSYKKRKIFLSSIFDKGYSALFISTQNQVPKIIKMFSNRYNMPVIVSPKSVFTITNRLSIYLTNKLAPSITRHGTLVDIYGVGVMLTGKSGIGKSECALDLVDRGHRLVADDVIKIYKKGEHILMGTGIAPDSSLQYHMEVRGVGILDIAKIFGIRGVRLHKRIEIEINLVEWKPDTDIERVGLKEEVSNILEVEIPLVKIPLLPGKNISVIAEVVALNHLLKIIGYDTSKVFNATLIKLMQEKAKKLARLEEDEE